MDYVCKEFNVSTDKKGYDGLYCQFNFNGEKVILVRPQTYMNDSGLCVSKVVNFFKCDLKDVLVIYDDIDLDRGCIRFRSSGSAGTHNGMRSIVRELNSEKFARLRIGAKKYEDNIPLINYVLMDIPKEQLEQYKTVFINAKDCVVDFIKGATADQLMCSYNGKK